MEPVCGVQHHARLLFPYFGESSRVATILRQLAQTAAMEMSIQQPFPSTSLHSLAGEAQRRRWAFFSSLPIDIPDLLGYHLGGAVPGMHRQTHGEGETHAMQLEGRPRVLVVDDDRLSQRLLEDMLLPLGYAVSVAGDGLAALDLARRFRPHLILLDVVMPVMDGFEACERLKSDPATANIPVVLVTSLEGRESKIRGLAVGASDFLAKPVDEAELALRVKNLLRVVEFEAFLQQHNQQLDAQVRERTRQLEDALEELRRSREQLKESYLDTIFRLTTVAEYKDGFTAGHIKRVGHYCRHLARTLGWSEDEQEAIFYASPMHDIGKIVIPTEILQKPGPLTAEEFAIAQGHTTAGAHILQGSTSAFIRLAEVIALTHHERFDGGGYPRGLRGAQVPLPGLIMNLADQYEALRSARPYKPRLSHERAVAIITRGDGRTEPSHFHPRVLEAFADSTATFAAIFEDSEQDR